MISTCLVLEHLLDDDRRVRLQLNVQPTTFNLFGVQPTLQYRFTRNPEGGQLGAAAGVLFTVAGHNSIHAFYPHFSLYYYWVPKGSVQMR